jgi:protein-disulfide isomerase
MQYTTQNKKWYQTPGGAIFLGVAIFLSVSFFIFLSFVAYYTWQIKFGDPEKLSTQFSTEFTIDPSKKAFDESLIIDEEMENFIYPDTPVYGSDDAPIVIAAFIDFECPFCQENYSVFKKIMDKYPSILKIAFKHVPVEEIHPNSMKAHIASTCAQEQNNFWEYSNLLFTYKKLDEISLLDYADKLKLDKEKFVDCLETEKYRDYIEKDIIDAARLEIRGTPTYIVNQIKLEGAVTEEIWSEIILELIKMSK